MDRIRLFACLCPLAGGRKLLEVAANEARHRSAGREQADRIARKRVRHPIVLSHHAQAQADARGHRIYDLARQILGRFDLARANVEEKSLRPSGTLQGQPAVVVRPALLDAGHCRIRPNLSGVRLDIRFSERFVNLVEEDRAGAADRTARDRARWSRGSWHGAAPIWLRRRHLSAGTLSAARTGRPQRAPMHRLFASARRQRLDIQIGTRPPRRFDRRAAAGRRCQTRWSRR